MLHLHSSSTIGRMADRLAVGPCRVEVRTSRRTRRVQVIIRETSSTVMAVSCQLSVSISWPMMMHFAGGPVVCHRASIFQSQKRQRGVSGSGSCHSPLCLAAAALWRDKDARHVATAGALIRDQAFVLRSRGDAQQLIHDVLAPRARHPAVCPRKARHVCHSFVRENPRPGLPRSRGGAPHRPRSGAASKTHDSAYVFHPTLCLLSCVAGIKAR